MLKKSDLRDRTALSVSTFVFGRMKETAGTEQLKHIVEGSVEQTVVTREPAGCGRSTSQLWQEYIAAVAGVHRSMSDVSLTVV